MRYILFAGNDKPQGGWLDFLEYYDARDEAEESGKAYSWYNIVDTKHEKIVYREEVTKKPNRKNIYVDFDGVLNSYQTSFTVPEDLPDPPNEGAIEWLEELIENFRVTIFSTRCIHPQAQMAITNWLFDKGLPWQSIEQLAFSAIKNGASVYIDDRGFRFEGTFPSVKELDELKVWYK